MLNPWLYRKKFLLTPLREGRRAASAILSWSSPFLLTPLREGRLGELYMALDLGNISTHAPAGGATAPTAAEK